MPQQSLVLIVEPDESLRDSLKDCLESSKLRVCTLPSLKDIPADLPPPKAIVFKRALPDSGRFFDALPVVKGMFPQAKTVCLDPGPEFLGRCVPNYAKDLKPDVILPTVYNPGDLRNALIFP